MGITKTGNKSLNRVQFQKSNDECYTTYESIEYGLKPFEDRGIFTDKVIYSPCDDFYSSEFVRYFRNHINTLEYKKYLSSGYIAQTYSLLDWELDLVPESPKLGEITYRKFKDGSWGYGEQTFDLNGDGSFLSKEVIDKIEKADIIVTNPPFSRFRNFTDLLLELKKDFIIIGHTLACCYQNWFPLIRDEKIKFRYCTEKHNWFNIPTDYGNWAGKAIYRKELGKYMININAGWFTNIILDDFDYNDAYPLELTAKYDEKNYRFFDNYPNLLAVDKVADIPMDYFGEMAVPVNYMVRHDPELFKIIDKLENGYIDGKEKFKRIVIKRK